MATNKLDRTERFALWCSGYSPGNLEAEPANKREPLAKLGIVVAFAGLCAAVMWGLLALKLAAALPTAPRTAAVLIASVMGGAITVFVDRSFLYFADTTTVSGWKAFAYAGVRIMIVLGFASLSAQATIPLFLGPELRAESLRMREASGQQRATALAARFEISSRAQALEAARSEVRQARQRARELPADIMTGLEAASRCWANHAARKSSLRRAGYTAAQARTELSGLASACGRQRRDAEAAREQHLAAAREELNAASANQQAVEVALTSARQAVATATRRAEEVEAGSLTELSAEVLQNLLRTNPGARAKWLLIVFLQTAIELLPMLVKLQAGRSSIGLRRADRHAQIDHDTQIARELRAVAVSAIHDPGFRRNLQGEFADEFRMFMPALAPIEAARGVLREIAITGTEKAAAIKQNPEFAVIISEAFGAAVERSVELLRNRATATPGATP